MNVFLTESVIPELLPLISFFLFPQSFKNNKLKNYNNFHVENLKK